ncbi:MAG: helix-turn-helix transcriptional regulator [Oscillospiraceae bacterium]|jgi:hypothetical protein|nr:helix-turn-helix transcriptional regulator [Oscillospiraceae bacterium]MCI8877729.1 helix-turn-helix transcriptional regulator [Oscillospiraceae bacterium]
MDFLEKLNYLMEKNHLNKSTLSKACNIPYTTIDGWYKKGYEGLKLTTLRKLADYFGTTLDYWAAESEEQLCQINLSDTQRTVISRLEKMNDSQVNAVLAFVNALGDIERTLSGGSGS